MNNWRLLDTSVRTSAENMALDETLLEAKANFDSPNTIRFLQFYPPAVLLGYHQNLDQEIRVDFCNNNGIEINRRITGGGTLFFDETQIGWEVICDKSFFKTEIANPLFFEILSKPVIRSLKKIGINAEFRPRNDIEVNGRKISGTGGTEYGKAFLFQGTLLVNFDVETMFKAFRVPIEKLKYKEIKSAKERVTCISWEINKIPDINDLKTLLKGCFEEEFNINLIKEDLTTEEKSLYENKISKFKSKEWIDKIKIPKDFKKNIYSINKAKGGIIRTTLSIDPIRNRIQDILFTGDFFTYPARTIFDLEAILRNTKVDLKIIENKVVSFFKNSSFRIMGIEDIDIIKSIEKALDKFDINKYGIPIDLANRIYTVNGLFRDIISLKPKHLLVPYCAKSIECGLRYKDECNICGLCNINDAYKTALEKNFWIKTILSFEDLMITLKKLKSMGVSSYIGSCCEAFYMKHLEDFEDIDLPGILIDIDSTTCYDLGKAIKAYNGTFENQTEFNTNLFNMVINVL